ncbi:hypothetical protein [Methylobacterium sp. ap11]|uniref:hypothetical protein n=1 Tax=Methylobacterium sp. ap11 TaxID=1761799 RepID=UPI0011604432|nr:hypothetical protein [Methylobacterium sp. ap11]
MARMSGPQFFGEFESEHLYSKKVFESPKRSQVLNKFGLTRDMMGNRRSLFTSADIINQLASIPDDHPFKTTLIESGWGTVLHRGGDTNVGGFQEGKTQFQIELIDSWIARSELSSADPLYISQDGLKYAIIDLHKFTDDLAIGRIKGATGVPLGVLGTDKDFL